MGSTDSTTAAFVQGQRLMISGDKKGARERFQEAVRADPGNGAAWLGIAQSSEDPEEALDALSKVLDLEPGNVEARNMRLSLMVGDLRRGVGEAERTARANPIKRFIVPALAFFVTGLCAVGLVFLIGSIPRQQNQVQAAAVSRPSPLPTRTRQIMPPTWTPAPTQRSTATPAAAEKQAVKGTNATVQIRTVRAVSLRAGPSPNFQSTGTLQPDVILIVLATDPSGKYYQVREKNSLLPLGWVPADQSYILVLEGDVATLQVVAVITPTRAPTRRPTATSTPTKAFKQIKYKTNPNGARCDRTLIQGTVWDQGDQQGYVPGAIVAVWIDGKIVKRDTSGSHPDSYAAKTGNRAYWEIEFGIGQGVSGKVGIVDKSDNPLSDPQPFQLTGGECLNPESINEIIIDFSH